MSPLKKITCMNALTLKVLAMVFMFLDHLWATLIPGSPWMTNVGRMAFPIFAFQIVEGYFHTHDFKKYAARLLIFALISEIPFNLMMSGTLVDPFDQNVMFTLLEGLLLVKLLEVCRTKSQTLFVVMVPITLLLGYVLGFITMVDYYGFGVMTVLLFYLTHDQKFSWLIQLGGLYVINVMLMGGMDFPVHLFGYEFLISQQGLAVLALIPIWLYNGKQGPHNKAIQYACYAFYPGHILVLSLLALASA